MITLAILVILASKNNSPSKMLYFEPWPEGMVKNQLILTRYGIQTRQAAFAALRISAPSLLCPPSHILMPVRGQVNQLLKNESEPHWSIFFHILISPSAEWPSVTFLGFFFLREVYHQTKKKADYRSCGVCITEFIWLRNKDKKVYIKKMMRKIRSRKKEKKKGKDQVRNRKRQRVCLFVNLNCAFVDDITIKQQIYFKNLVFFYQFVM